MRDDKANTRRGRDASKLESQSVLKATMQARRQTSNNQSAPVASSTNKGKLDKKEDKFFVSNGVQVPKFDDKLLKVSKTWSALRDDDPQKYNNIKMFLKELVWETPYLILPNICFTQMQV